MSRHKLPSHRRTLRLIACGATFFAVSCGSTEPSVQTATYDFSATFTTFSFETGAYGPDCDPYAEYCTHFRPTTMGALSGSFVTSKLPGNDGPPPYPGIQATLAGKFCSAWNDSGCTAVMDTTSTYVGTDPALDSAISLKAQEGPILRLMSVVRTPDSLYGDVSWSMYSYRSPPTLTGHWIARRVK